MKILIFGLGSIGQRHLDNLRSLRSDARIVIADPRLFQEFRDESGRQIFLTSTTIIGGNLGESIYYMDWHEELLAHPDSDAAIIASPTEAHLEQMFALWNKNIPFYCEKPLCSIDQLSKITYGVSQERSAAGHQYRFHPAIHRAELREARTLHFYARDNLIDRYGLTCLETMTSHPIDMALWTLGPARYVDMQTDGVSVSGFIEHESGRSGYDIAMNADKRESIINIGGRKIVDLPPDNQMYLDALSSWLRWVEGSERDERTATIADGLAVMRVMAEVKHVERIGI